MNDTIPALGQFIEPSPIRFIPEAPGWYALAIVCLIILLFAGLLIRKYRKKNRYRRLALNWLDGEEKKCWKHRIIHGLFTRPICLPKKSASNYTAGRIQPILAAGSGWIT